MSAADIAAALGGKKSGNGWVCRCVAHEDANPSLSIADGDAGIVVRCHAGCDQQSVIGALKAKGLWPERKVNGSDRQIVTTYDYADEHGAVLYQVVRYFPKDFRQRRPDGDGWAWSVKGVRLVPYRLPELIAAIGRGETVYVVEGEKDVEALAKLGLTATTNSGGAGKWRDEFGAHFAGARVVILPDKDAPGRAHAQRVARSLGKHTAEVKVIELPGSAKDASDWIAAGGTREALEQIVEEQRKPAAAIDGSELLDEVHEYLDRYVSYPSEHAKVAHVLWVAHTHAMDAWESTPRIAFLSPEPASGKTRALEVTRPLVPRPLFTVNATNAAIFRKVSDPAGLPTLLWDEIDTLFGPRAKEHEEVRGLLNAGHRRGATALRCVVRGKEIEVEELPAYCPVALAGLGDLPDTILTRSVVVKMRRRTPDERVAPWRDRDCEPPGHALRDRLAAWLGSLPDLADRRPQIPPAITDRHADCWEPLLVVADAAGGIWPERARVSAVTLVTDAMERNPSLGVHLLSDLRCVFGERNAVFTSDLLKGLTAMEESPWGDLKGKPLDGRRLARLLKKYGIKPRPIRIGATVERGYDRQDFYDAWTRYL